VESNRAPALREEQMLWVFKNVVIRTLQREKREREMKQENGEVFRSLR
jgi:hypothetical protein